MKTYARLTLGLFALTLGLGIAWQGQAGIERVFQKIVPVSSQAMLAKDTFTSPILANTTYILSANAGPTSAAAKVVSTFAHQPDVPRNLTITPGGTTGDVESCVITVSGTNIKGKAITEDFTFAQDASTVQTGNKAFKTVTSVSWPANCESGTFGASWSVGVGSKLGTNWCLANAGDVAWAEAAGVFESTRPTMAVDSTHVESNTAIFNTALDGSKTFKLFYVENYVCK